MLYQVSDNDLKRVFAILKKKGVNYVDVQHEIADHIATEIERISLDNPKLNFEQKLGIVLIKFPEDWKKFVRSQEKSMNRYWRRRTLGYIKSYFTFPKLLLTLAIYLVTVASTIIVGKSVLLVLISFLLILTICIVFNYYKTINFNTNRANKYLVLKMFFGQTMTVLATPICLINVAGIKSNAIDNVLNWQLLTVSFVVVFTLIWSHACLTEFPKMLQEELSVKYPYINLSN